jgi:hypothetical protein
MTTYKVSLNQRDPDLWVADVEAVTPEPRVLLHNKSGTLLHVTAAVGLALKRHANNRGVPGEANKIC